MLKKINSLEEYFTEYKKSISDPEKFWEEQANSFCWQKNGRKCLIGILKNLKLNGLKEES